MIHPKMLYTYVGVDSHKDTHTAVFLDCFFEKLGEITFDNLPSKFDSFLNNALKLQREGTTLMFGLEDISAYGRTLTVFLKDNYQHVKHVNAFLVAKERKNQTVTEKTDSVDAECAARVLLSKLSNLPDAEAEDKYWMLRTLVVHRDFIVKNNISLKNHLHTLLTGHFPGYGSFFSELFSNTSLAFFMQYPSPGALKDTTEDDLTAFFHEQKARYCRIKAQKILESVRESPDIPLKEVREDTVRSAIRQIQFNMQEIERLETALAELLSMFETTLTSMKGIEVVTAAKILSCVGNIRRFSSAAKLAKYAGIAPVTYASGKTDQQFSNKRGNRELNSVFYMLSIRLIASARGNITNPFFYEYYRRKLGEGKTKRQALKCVERRLVNIIWGMLYNGREYVVECEG